MATTQIDLCEERLQLTTAVLDAVRELVDLQNRETIALIQGNALDGLQIAIQLARQRHDNVKEALLMHTFNHGC